MVGFQVQGEASEKGSQKRETVERGERESDSDSDSEVGRENENENELFFWENVKKNMKNP